MMVDVSAGTDLHQFMRSLSDNWDRNIVDDVLRRTPGAVRQPDVFLHEWKSSWYLHDAPASLLGEIETALNEAGLRTKLIYSSNRDLDIVPAAAGKGAALAWLCRHLGIATSAALVAGDTGNDASMFLVPGVRGIIVANALPELLAATTGAETFLSLAPCAQGVVDGLRHYGALT
jgi:sucrose-6F-phosphate phosphohydrolase